MKDTRLYNTIKEYALKTLDKEEGTRSNTIIEDIKKTTGITPTKIDENKNIWYEKGEGKKAIVITAHMDTVFGKKEEEYAIGETGDGQIIGALDNALGCAINAEAIKKINPEYKTIFIFTTNEEYGMSGAKKALEQLKENKETNIELCIALDVTYPPEEEKPPVKRWSRPKKKTTTREFKPKYEDDPLQAQMLSVQYGITMREAQEYLMEIREDQSTQQPKTEKPKTEKELLEDDVKHFMKKLTKGDYMGHLKIKPGQLWKEIAPLYGELKKDQEKAVKKLIETADQNVSYKPYEGSELEKEINGLKLRAGIEIPKKEQKAYKSFAENFPSTKLEEHIKGYAKKAGDNVGVRSMRTADEASIFGDEYNAMALGPVVTGNMHSLTCKGEYQAVETVVEFLDQILTDKEFIEHIPTFEKPKKKPAYQKIVDKVKDIFTYSKKG